MKTLETTGLRHAMKAELVHMDWYMYFLFAVNSPSLVLSQQTWSGFSPITVPDDNRQSVLSPMTVPEMSTGMSNIFKKFYILYGTTGEE